MNNFLFEKVVDQSLLKDGLTVPKEACYKLQASLGINLNKGDSVFVPIIVENKEYEARVINVNLSVTTSGRTVFQIRYSPQSGLSQHMNNMFPRISKYIADNKGAGERLVVPDDIQESINIYVTDSKKIVFKPKNNASEILAEFFKYLGPVNSLGGYERSYKLVFYKSYFESLKREEVTTTEHIAALFREYYINRIRQGKVPDLNVSKAIANPEESTVKDALDVILKNPFNVIQNKGFFRIEKQDGQECFQMVPELASAITDVEIDKILDIVEQKLKLYY